MYLIEGKPYAQHNFEICVSAAIRYETYIAEVFRCCKHASLRNLLVFSEDGLGEFM